MKPGSHFDAYEEQIVCSAAARLGDFLFQTKIKKVGVTAWLESLSGTPIGKSVRELDEFYLGLFHLGVGPCEAGIRCCDRLMLPDGSEIEALRPVMKE